MEWHMHVGLWVITQETTSRAPYEVAFVARHAYEYAEIKHTELSEVERLCKEQP